MRGKIQEAISHGIIAFLYALGLTLTLLHVLELTGNIGAVLPVMILLIAVMAASTLKKWAGWAMTGGMALLAALWLALGGLSVVVEVFRGVTLHLSGLTAALPLVAGETAMLVGVAVAIISFLLTFRATGAYPAMTVLMLALMLLWLGNRPSLLVWLLPSVAAILTLLVLSNHEGLTIRRVLPTMLAAALAAFLVIPTGGVTIGPLKKSADTLRQRIFDYFFFTEPRDVFSLAVEGYYPQGQSQLGGPANPNDHYVMQVVTNRRTYLRGAIKNEYTGRTWLDTTGGRRYLWTGLRWQSVRSEAFDMKLPAGLYGSESSLTRASAVSVRMLTDSMSSLFVPQRIRQLSPGGDLVPYFNIGSEVFVTRNLQAGDTWTVQAPLVQAGDTGLDILLEGCAQLEDPAYESIRSTYTALPEHLQQELYDLARRVTSSAETPYQMALTLQNYLSRSYRYTLEVAQQPTDVDFVTYFLFQSREGYCTYFASAMTVLCRMLGLPARYVEGYVAEPDEQGHAIVTGENGHAWTEVYFSGFGWLTFDATPRTISGAPSNEGDSPESDNPPPEDEPSPTPTPDPEDNEIPPPETPSPSPEPTPEPTPTDSPKLPPEEENRQGPNLWWLLVLLLLIAAVALRILWMQPERVAARAKDEEGRWMAWTQALYDELRVLKLPRHPSESPLTYLRRLDATAPMPLNLDQIGQGEAMVFYGGAAPREEATFMVKQAVLSIWAAMKPTDKVKMTLQRAFWPKTRMDFTKRGNA